MSAQAVEIAAWFTGRLPDGWSEGPPEVGVDREEVLVVGRLAPPAAAPGEVGPGGGDPEGGASRAAAVGRIQRFREDTRDQRVQIAREAEHRFGRKVAWGAVCGDERQVFTSLAIPAMTRLRQPERQVLDTLVDAGVARSRSEALAWCVKLVGDHEGDWISELRDALTAVEAARAAGPPAA